MTDKFILNLKEIIDTFLWDESFDDYIPLEAESMEEERDIIEEYVSRYIATDSKKIHSFAVRSDIDDHGVYLVRVDGYNYKVNFSYVLH